MRRLLTALGSVIIVAGLGAACGGGSSAGTPAASSPSSSPSSSPAASGNAAICQKLATDAKSFAGLQTTATSRSKVVSALDSLADKLKSDAAGGSPTLKSGVAKFASALDDAADIAKHTKKPNLKSIGAKLQSGEADLVKACPDIQSS